METQSDRLPPHNLDAERMVLSACLLDAQAIDDVLLVLKDGDFYREAHGLAYGAIRALREDGREVDAVTLADELARRGQFERIGGDDFLAEIAGAAPHAANARYHADIVRQKAVTRGLVALSTDTIREAYSGLWASDQLVESAERRLFALRDAEARDSSSTTEELVGDALTRIRAREEADGASEGLGVPSGFADLDQFIDRLKPEEMTVLAARPSQGKTALAMQIAVNAALDSGVRCLVVSLEMGRQALADRMLANHAPLDGAKIVRPWTMTFAEKHRLAKAAAELSGAPIVVDDAPTRTVGQIAAMGRRMKRRGGLGLIVVDYLQLIDDERGRGESRHEGVARISRRLKATARELGVPVLALSQLNRQSEQREGLRPRLADLRESGQIEQDADAVLLLHRPDFYDPNDQPGIAEVIVAKNRNGPTGATRLVFLKSFTRFESLQFGEAKARPLEADVA